MALRPPTPLLLIAALLAIGAGLVWHRSSSSPRPDLVVVVVDTLRADRLGSYGDAQASTPFLDRLAKSGLRFERAYAPASWTLPSVASLFTSRYPSQHRVASYDSRLSDSEQTLAEQLWLAGYRTGGFTANWRMNWDNAFHQGFDLWNSLFPEFEPEVKISGGALTDAAMTWLDTVDAEPSRPPVFLYLQYMEPHAPLLPPPGLRERFAPGLSDAEVARLNAKSVAETPAPDKGLLPVEASALERLYRAAVADADRQLERLFQELARRGHLENALVVVTADHGEEFLEHGAVGHGTDLYEESVRVPLILNGPMVTPRVVAEPVSLIDLAPTLLEVGRAQPEPRFEGRSRAYLLGDDLVSWIRRLWRYAEGSDVHLQLPVPASPYGGYAHEAGLVRGAQKLLVDPKGQASAYDLDRDPGERSPSKEGRIVERLSVAMDAFDSRIARLRLAEAEKVRVDAATVERLRALGYQQ